MVSSSREVLFLGGALRTFFFVVRHKFVFVLGDL